MANPVAANIIKSGAQVWYAPTGETLPDETSVAFGAAWGGNWARVGYTKAPLTFTYEDERTDITVEEVLAPVLQRRISENAMFETTLAELTATYLKLAAGGQGTVSTTAAGAGQKGYEELTFGDEVIIEEKRWGFEGMYVTAAGVEQPIRVFVYKGVALLNGDLEFSKKTDDYVGIPLQVKALADTDNSNRLWTFQRVTAPAT